MPECNYGEEEEEEVGVGVVQVEAVEHTLRVLFFYQLFRQLKL